MNMKQPIVIMAAMSLAIGVRAQSVDEGIKMYNYERYQSAKKILGPLAGTNPLANYYLGLSELQMGNKDVAKAIFMKQPDNNPNASGLARVSFIEGNANDGMAKATAIANKAKKKDWEPYRYAADAITYTNGGNVQQAIDWYKSALNVYDDLSTHISLGDAYQKLPGGGGEAMTNYEKVVDKDPKNSLAYSRIGKLWYEAKNYKLALENWEKAQEADPNNPLPYRDLANAYTYVGKYDLAKKNADKYMELSDKTDEDLDNYVSILFLSKSYKEAIENTNQLIGKGKTSPRYYGILGFSYFGLGDSAKALENAKIYMEKQDPAKITPDDNRKFAGILLANGKKDDANKYLLRAVSLDSSANKADAYRENGDLLRESREWLLAADWYERIVLEYPDQATANDYFYAAFSRYYGRDYEKAAQGFAKMRDKYPGEPSPIYWQGRAAAAIDNEAKSGLAAPFYEEWLNLKTPDSYVRKNSDLMQAYLYMLLYGYNKDDNAMMDKYGELLRGIDPTNATLKQIDDIRKSRKKGK